MAKLDPQAFGTKSMSQRDIMSNAMNSMKKPAAKKMPPAKVAARKKTMISNAATKVMGGSYSK